MSPPGDSPLFKHLTVKCSLNLVYTSRKSSFQHAADLLACPEMSIQRIVPRNSRKPLRPPTFPGHIVCPLGTEGTVPKGRPEPRVFPHGLIGNLTIPTHCIANLTEWQRLFFHCKGQLRRRRYLSVHGGGGFADPHRAMASDELTFQPQHVPGLHRPAESGVFDTAEERDLSPEFLQGSAEPLPPPEPAPQ